MAWNLTIRNNPLLPECQATALRTRLGANVAGTVTISGNSTTATCP